MGFPQISISTGCKQCRTIGIKYNKMHMESVFALHTPL
jgi:hypothetical protein